MNEKFKKLQEKLPEEAIQRTKKFETKKGYDTDGYGYQYCVNRFNDAYGTGWGFDWEIIKETEGSFKSGQKYFEITVKVGIWIESERPRTCVGGHLAGLYADALKGAITNAFKKTAAFWGVGRNAYEGSIDDDNKPMPDHLENIQASSCPGMTREILDAQTFHGLSSDQMLIIREMEKCKSHSQVIDYCKDAKERYSDQLFQDELKKKYREVSAKFTNGAKT